MTDDADTRTTWRYAASSPTHAHRADARRRGRPDGRRPRRPGRRRRPGTRRAGRASPGAPGRRRPLPPAPSPRRRHARRGRSDRGGRRGRGPAPAAVDRPAANTAGADRSQADSPGRPAAAAPARSRRRSRHATRAGPRRRSRAGASWCGRSTSPPTPSPPDSCWTRRRRHSQYAELRQADVSCVAAGTPGERVAATYQRAPAVLVFHAPASGSQVVDLFVCGSQRPVRSATLPAG